MCQLILDNLEKKNVSTVLLAYLEKKITSQESLYVRYLVRSLKTVGVDDTVVCIAAGPIT